MMTYVGGCVCVTERRGDKGERRWKEWQEKPRGVERVRLDGKTRIGYNRA